MTSSNPILRGGIVPAAPYPLGQIPDQVVFDVSKAIVLSYAVGRDDISGDDWSDIFSAAIGATHLKSPLGITDVTFGGAAWSAKTVQSANVSGQKSVRLISGRNAVDLSFQNQEPRANPQLAGGQVLQIWNARLEQAREQYSNLRTVVLVRDMAKFRFKMFELEPRLYDPSQYCWTVNDQGNFEGRTLKEPKTHVFTWQPAGSQFTIIADVPSSGRKFQLQKPPRLDVEVQLKAIGYSDSWVTLLGSSIDSLSFASEPESGGRYGTGETVLLNVVFADTVVVEGDPLLKLKVGKSDCDATYLGGSGTRELLFGYAVMLGDRAPGGVRVEADSLNLNGGTIRDAQGRMADLSHPRLPANNEQRVLGK